MQECAGTPCVVEHVDGTRRDGCFPREIAPHQPFTAVRAIAHEAAPGVWARVRCEGDAFEMEDQRNWTDASYKTYCTPLDRAFPVLVEQGTVVQQSVTLSLEGMPRAWTSAVASGAGSDHVEVSVDVARATPLPRLGVALDDHRRPLDPAAAALLRALRPAHLRVELPLHDVALATRLHVAAESARALGVPWEAALVVTDDAEVELRRLRTELDTLRPAVARWLVFHVNERSTSARWVALARRALGDGVTGAPVGGGTNAYFAHLNRGRPPAGAFDVVCYSINPQVHAFDDLSLVETLPMHAETARAARRIAGGAAVAVGPVTLRPRFNPSATGPAAAPATADPRLSTLLGAAWTLGSVKWLAEGGAESVTYFATGGPHGILDTPPAGGAPTVHPPYHVLADACEWADADALATESSDPLRVEALMLRRAGETRLLLANLSPEPQRVRVRNPAPGALAHIRRLDAATVDGARREPARFRSGEGEPLDGRGDSLLVELGAHACACVDARS